MSLAAFLLGAILVGCPTSHTYSWEPSTGSPEGYRVAYRLNDLDVETTTLGPQLTLIGLGCGDISFVESVVAFKAGVPDSEPSPSSEPNQNGGNPDANGDSYVGAPDFELFVLLSGRRRCGRFWCLE